MGPKSRAVIQAVTKTDMSNAAFKFGEVLEIEIAGHKVRALRVTYVGELGWELHMPIAATGEVFDALMAAGKPHGIAPVGYRALESLRLEKGYRAWSSDITPNDTPLHAGLGWAVKMKSNQAFLGREAIEKIAQAPLTKMLAGFTTEREDIVDSGRCVLLEDGLDLSPRLANEGQVAHWPHRGLLGDAGSYAYCALLTRATRPIGDRDKRRLQRFQIGDGAPEHGFALVVLRWEELEREARGRTAQCVEEGAIICGHASTVSSDL